MEKQKKENFHSYLLKQNIVKVNEAELNQGTKEIPVQVNGKLRATLKLPFDTAEEIIKIAAN